MVMWDRTLVCTRTIIPLTKPKLYSIPRFENEKEKNKNNKNNFTGYGYTACLSDGGRFFKFCVLAVLAV